MTDIDLRDLLRARLKALEDMRVEEYMKTGRTCPFIDRRFSVLVLHVDSIDAEAAGRSGHHAASDDFSARVRRRIAGLADLPSPLIC